MNQDSRNKERNHRTDAVHWIHSRIFWQHMQNDIPIFPTRQSYSPPSLSCSSSPSIILLHLSSLLPTDPHRVQRPIHNGIVRTPPPSNLPQSRHDLLQRIRIAPRSPFVAKGLVGVLRGVQTARATRSCRGGEERGEGVSGGQPVVRCLLLRFDRFGWIEEELRDVRMMTMRMEKAGAMFVGGGRAARGFVDGAVMKCKCVR